MTFYFNFYTLIQKPIQIPRNGTICNENTSVVNALDGFVEYFHVVSPFSESTPVAIPVNVTFLNIQENYDFSRYMLYIQQQQAILYVVKELLVLPEGPTPSPDS